MPVPVYQAGQVVGAADVNNWFVPLAAYKPATTGRSSTTTLTADPDLTVTVAANAAYDVTLYASYSTGATSGIGFRWGWIAPAGFSGWWGAMYRISGDTATGSNAGASSSPAGLWSDIASSSGAWPAAATPGDNKNHCLIVRGFLILGSTGGAFTFRWAQDNSNGTALNLNYASKMILLRAG
jgi:hypothetical protein